MRYYFLEKVYKQLYPKKKYQVNLSVDLTSLFTQAKTISAISDEGLKILSQSTKESSSTVAQAWRGKEEPSVANDESSTVDEVPELSTDDDGTSSEVGNDPLSAHVILSNGFDLAEAFKDKSNLQSKDQTKEERRAGGPDSLSHVLLLNDDQHGRSFIKHMRLANVELFLASLKQKYMKADLKINKTIFLQLDIKLELQNLAVDADAHDSAIINSLLNCVNKLPDYELDMTIGEQELITNYVDPILSPIFHQPTNGRLFRWADVQTWHKLGGSSQNNGTANRCTAPDHPSMSKHILLDEKKQTQLYLKRETDDTKTLRPDAGMYMVKQRHTHFAIGFCEVKADDESNLGKIHENLAHLSEFCRSSLDLNHVKALIAVQVVGKTISFYLFALESNGLYCF
ncbi:hypothetical protein DFQ29_004532 [Apophysomyces sp. BC1021]|nr:hypothetical protein DFQ29_004532 [Apophysomyces sp. BC1021]